MARCWLLFLLIGMVTAGKPRKGPPLTLQQAGIESVKQYNEEAGASPVYRLENLEPVVKWDSTVKSYRYFNLTIKETVCNNKKKVEIDTCEYKSHGVTKTCRVGYRYVGGAPQMKITCKRA
ncbi:cathelicidin-related antimicrobial peptide Na_CRAMP-like [Anolis carolinensis]|uniref:cathelicidin-related antimicrobial peptide Na_CRAMP-like n=1 Tax=Anolis carolinensis TaxID=28377 RepID=UPI002F2B7CD3